MKAETIESVSNVMLFCKESAQHFIQAVNIVIDARDAEAQHSKDIAEASEQAAVPAEPDDDATVERVAKAIAAADGIAWDGENNGSYRRLARAAINATNDGLDGAELNHRSIERNRAEHSSDELQAKLAAMTTARDNSVVRWGDSENRAKAAEAKLAEAGEPREWWGITHNGEWVSVYEDKYLAKRRGNGTEAGLNPVTVRIAPRPTDAQCLAQAGDPRTVLD